MKDGSPVKKHSRRVLAILLLLVSGLAAANPFSVTYTDTISAGSGAGYIVGQSLSITFVLDNGGTSTISQTWNATDVVSVTFVLNNGAITTVFNPNGGGGFNSPVLGNFATDNTGTLVSAPVNWESDTDNVVSSNDPQGITDINWYVTGLNSVYNNLSNYPPTVNAFVTNPGNTIKPAFWSFDGVPPPPPPPPGASAPVTVPTMSIYALAFITLGLLLLGARRLRISARRE
jgi:hypothetical protein